MNDFIRENFRYEDGHLYRLKDRGGAKAGSKAGWLTYCNGRPYRKMNVNAKALASILISFIVATLTISVAPNIDSKSQSKAVSIEKNSSSFRWGEGEI